MIIAPTPTATEKGVPIQIYQKNME